MACRGFAESVRRRVTEVPSGGQDELALVVDRHIPLCLIVSTPGHARVTAQPRLEGRRAFPKAADHGMLPSLGTHTEAQVQLKVSLTW